MTKVAETYLLNIMREWKRQRDAFISKCQEDEKPIRKVQVNNFTTVNFIKKNKSKKPKNLQKLKEREIYLGGYFFYHSNKKYPIPNCA